MKYYYHFTSDKLRDGRPIPAIGEWLVHKGKCVMCESGLHASAHPFDALKYAPGNLLHLVELGEIKDSHDDKVLSDRRKIIKTINAEKILRLFACDCAESVLHLFEEKYPDDRRPRHALKVARDFANGLASRSDLAAALDAAWAAGNAAWAAGDAAWAAGDAAWAAGDAALDEFRDDFKKRVEKAFSES